MVNEAIQPKCEGTFRPLSRRQVQALARNVTKVPFVELLGGRLQGVVSSGSDMDRVYVSWIEAGTHNYYCSTNNNRPCGGLRGSPCKHLDSLLQEAVLQYDLRQVATYLKLRGDPESYTAKTLGSGISGNEKKEPAGAVFSRFLAYLRLCELAAPAEVAAEDAWFV